jgi:hypothetical protein
MWFITITWWDDKGKRHFKPLRDLGQFDSELECAMLIEELHTMPRWSDYTLQPVEFHDN